MALLPTSCRKTLSPKTLRKPISTRRSGPASVPLARQTAETRLYRKAEAFGLRGQRVDGNSIDAVYVATREAAAALQPWHEQTERVGVRTLILSLLGALTIAMLVRQLDRVAASERALVDRGKASAVPEIEAAPFLQRV